jgi:DNA-binding transcriptional MerR regulator
MRAELSSGDLARATGNTVRAIRFYEEEGLLTPAVISDGGHRRYTQEDLERLCLIADLREVGLSLCEIKSILELQCGCTNVADFAVRFQQVLGASRAEAERRPRTAAPSEEGASRRARGDPGAALVERRRAVPCAVADAAGAPRIVKVLARHQPCCAHRAEPPEPEPRASPGRSPGAADPAARTEPKARRAPRRVTIIYIIRTSRLRPEVAFSVGYSAPCTQLSSPRRSLLPSSFPAPRARRIRSLVPEWRRGCATSRPPRIRLSALGRSGATTPSPGAPLRARRLRCRLGTGARDDRARPGERDQMRRRASALGYITRVDHMPLMRDALVTSVTQLERNDEACKDFRRCLLEMAPRAVPASGDSCVFRARSPRPSTSREKLRSGSTGETG